MKIAFCYQNDMHITGQAGKCTKFMLYDIQDKEIVSKGMVELEESITFHNVFHNGTIPFNEHPLSDIDVVISDSMGAGFVQKMKRVGITALMTTETDIEKALDAFLSNKLELVLPEGNSNQ